VYALEAIGRLSLEDVIACGHVAAVLKSLEDPSWIVRHAAASFLQSTPGVHSKAVPQLEMLLNSADPSLRLVAVSIVRSSLSISDGMNSLSHLIGVVESLDDKTSAMAAVEVAGESLRYVREDLKSDPEVVHAALRQCGRSLQHAAPELRRDRSAVLMAITQDGLSLQYAADELREDADVIFEAVKQNEAAICYASEHIRYESFMQDIMEESDDLIAYWQSLEASIFDDKMAEPSASYLAKRDEFIKLIRSLAKDLEVPDCWTHALTLLDAFHSVSQMGELVGNDTAIAAVMLAGKLVNGRLSYLEKSGLVALHFGRGYELNPRDLRTLHSAEMHMLAALGANLLLPSVAKWVDVLFRRMMVFATRDVANTLREAAPIAQQVAEIVAIRIPASSSMLPRKLALSSCALTLVGVGLLPSSEFPYFGGVDDKISRAFNLETLLSCCETDGIGSEAQEKWNWPAFETGSPVVLEARVFAQAAGSDVERLKSDVLSTLYVSG
jgi:hypothetical protein